MQTLKYFVVGFVISGALFFLFGPEVIPVNFQSPEVLDVAADNDIIIIFNSGGWGNTPIEKAEDFAPIIKGIQETLNSWGYKSVVIPYNRTKNNFFGRIRGIREFLNQFKNSSEDLAERIESLVKSLPDKKIIVTGLSNGAAFVTETQKRISKKVKGSVYTIAVGTPFWTEVADSDNILQLDNIGKDTLVKGDVKSLILSLIKAPFVGKFSASGHDYLWNSPEVNSQIIAFLEDGFR
jgi:hypothetical protein